MEMNRLESTEGMTLPAKAPANIYDLFALVYIDITQGQKKNSGFCAVRSYALLRATNL